MAEVIKFTSLGYGDLRLAKQYCSRPILENLFQTEGGIIIVDQNGEEIIPDNESYTLIPSNTYTVVSEKDLESDSEEDENHHNNRNTDYLDDYDDEDDSNQYEIDQDHSQHVHNHNHDSSSSSPCCGGDHDHSEHIKENNQFDQVGFQKLLKMREERIKMIKENYTPKHPEIFKLKEEFFEDKFINAVREYKKDKNNQHLLNVLNKMSETGLYSFKIFNMDFCSKLLEEIENFRDSGLPTARVNSMNNYGLVLDEIGFTSFFQELREGYLSLFTALLYPNHYGDRLDSHHAFIVQYAMEKEVDLGFHYDESNVTLNLCLGKQFTGGSLYFKGILNEPKTHNELLEVQHSVGTALFHIGVHRHGVNSLTSGERTNLILWLRYTSGISE
ncbi:putative prolyl 4-hydroxylase alpha subunit [Tieghemostelium lacteum]|uniref:Putative prolyl 4-hydroxylase alpha subunit n=1 Tax=Tieghemostelium lacteum TaxID=361077 RepID=A0A152A164_TIELA|nr:putative prolyl 4-hydroxylase alpha subunit [Tieghemostelium lacteum]|eukprot:KYQ99938.1 putative prolyl 4-hydroxylase alpha subunit [Tieghemostelium lacteum]